MKTQENGFTIIELLVALLLAAIVTTAAMALYTTQHKQLLVQDEVSDMQSNIRAATTELANRVRMAGYKLPDFLTAIEASNTNPDTITITFDAGPANDIQIEHDMPQPSSELRCDGHSLEGIVDNDWLYIYDPFTKTGEFFLATQIQYSSSNIQHNTMSLSKRYPTGSKLLKIDRLKYYIDQSDPNHPCLMKKRGGDAAQVYADNITGLNFSYVLSSGVVVDAPPICDMVREVIITVNARNDKMDDEFQNTYRFRVLTTSVRVRNLGVN